MKPPEDPTSIDEAREAIDGLDREVLRLLGERARYVAAARSKTDRQAVHAPERQRAILAQRRRWATEEGLDPTSVESLYQNIVSHFVGREMDRRGEAPAR